MTSVVNIDRGDEYDVYCGRPGKGLPGPFGNFASREGWNRYQNVAAFRKYFYDRIERDVAYRDAVHALKGMRLSCFCAPLLCHVMIIVEYLEGISPEMQITQYVNSHILNQKRSRIVPKRLREQPLEPDMFDTLAE